MLVSSHDVLQHSAMARALVAKKNAVVTEWLQQNQRSSGHRQTTASPGRWRPPRGMAKRVHVGCYMNGRSQVREATDRY